MKRNETDLNDLTRLIRESPKGPDEFSNLIAAWNGFFEDTKSVPLDAGIGEAVEAASQDALEALEKSSKHAASVDLERLLQSFRFPVILSDDSGKILASNSEAHRLPNIKVGRAIDESDIELVEAEPMAQAIRNALSGGGINGPLLKQGFAHDAARPIMIAILPARKQAGNSQLALVFFIDLVWRPEAGSILAESAGLTEAEANILEAFVSGNSLPEIAALRESSLATVRTQFQSILGKTSASNQAGLLRKSIALSGFVESIEETAQTALHPHRKSGEMLRPGGRRIDVTLAGDPEGEVVIFLANATQKTFQPQIEAAFAQANLCVVSICRPGTGRTDPAPDGADIDICMAEDVSAVQSQLGFQSSKLLTNSTSAAFGFRVAKILGPRITRMLVVSGFPPAPYIASNTTGSPFASAMVRAASTSPTLLAFLTRSGLSAWKLLGTKRFLSLQLASNPEDIALATRPECLSEFEAGFNASLARGTAAGIYELKIGAADWTPWVRDCPCPVDWFHGTKDGAANIEAVRQLSRDMSGIISLREFKGAGWMLLFSHTADVVANLTR